MVYYLRQNILNVKITDIFLAGPKDMKSQNDPIGKHNDHFLRCLFEDADILDIICGWGCHGEYRNRGDEILKMMGRYGIIPKALDWTKEGHPKHPLYIPYSAQPHERSKNESAK